MKGREREWLLLDCASTSRSCAKESLQWSKELSKKKIQQKGGGDANFEAMAGGDSGINTGHLLHLHQDSLRIKGSQKPLTWGLWVFIGFLFCMFFNFYPSDLHNETCVALANLRWSIKKKLNQKSNLLMIQLWLSEVHIWRFLNRIHRPSLRIVFTIECG